MIIIRELRTGDASRQSLRKDFKTLSDKQGCGTLGFYLNRQGAVKGCGGNRKVRLKEFIDRC
jgi:hypothetical protein